MVRELVGGMTDYSHQSLDDIVTDLTAEAENAKAFIRQIEENIEASKKSGYWDAHVPSDFKSCVAFSLKHYTTAVSEIEDIVADFEVEIKKHHYRRLESIAQTADKVNRRIGEVWHQYYPKKEYGKPEFIVVESVYADTRDMAVNLLDFSNIAVRLKHFVGRTGRTRTMASNPWGSGSFYLVAVVLILTVLAVIAKWVSWYALPGVIVGGTLLVGIVGAFQLRNDDKLKEENFVRIMIEVYKRLFLLRPGGSKENV